MLLAAAVFFFFVAFFNKNVPHKCKDYKKKKMSQFLKCNTPVDTGLQ